MSTSIQINLTLPTHRDLQAAAAYAGVDMATVMKRADLSMGVWRRWESGRGLPSMQTVQRMIDVIRQAQTIKQPEPETE
jgi:predicted transcriptional regulator